MFLEMMISPLQSRCFAVMLRCVSHVFLPFRPLRKMATGMVFAALAFGAATLVEINVVVRTNPPKYHLQRGCTVCAG